MALFPSAPRAFRDDKAVGDYIDELAYISAEEMKYAHIPETRHPAEEENWTGILSSQSQSTEVEEEESAKAPS